MSDAKKDESGAKTAASAAKPQTYQSHAPDKSGMSESSRKLQALSLPERMDGWSVLDIGCNEGFFCKEASRRGAASVVGIDLLETNVSLARKLYGDDPKINFFCQSWQILPEGKFDLILWTSAMHYERNPANVLGQIHSRLSPNGIFVFEGGILPIQGLNYGQRSRFADTCFYPTMDYMVDVLLKNFSTGRMAGPYKVQGDDTPRHVIHCKRRRKVVVLISGGANSGKTNLARDLASSSVDNIISLDALVWAIVSSKYHHGELEKFLAKANMSALSESYDEIGKTPSLCKDFGDYVALHTPVSDRTVIIEGYMPGGIADAIKSSIGQAIFWECTRV